MRQANGPSLNASKHDFLIPCKDKGELLYLNGWRHFPQFVVLCVDPFVLPGSENGATLKVANIIAYSYVRVQVCMQGCFIDGQA
jgi:hypothetical protein